MPSVHPSLVGKGFINQIAAEKIADQLTDKDIAKMLDVKVEAKLPTGVAIAMTEEYSSHLAILNSDAIKAWEKALCREPEIRGVHPIPNILVSSITLESLRAAAARMNCELLLVCTKDSACVDNYNNAAALYWTFIGLWLAPGSEYERKVVYQAALFDCRTGMLLGIASGESSLKTVYAAAYQGIAQDKIDAEAPVKAMENLQKNVGEMISQVVASARVNGAEPKTQPATSASSR